MAKILVVEDNPDMAEFIIDSLIAERHIVDGCAESMQAMELLKYSDYDIVILDWNLPDGDGTQILKQYRSQGGTAGVIMLTGKSKIADKEIGFQSGSDDYLTKPFEISELKLRVQALLRRARTTSSDVLKIGTVELHPIKHTVLQKGTQVHLAPRDFSLLEFFMRHPSEMFTADMLLARIWETDTTATGEVVRNAIARIRKSLDQPGCASVIENVPKLGYRLRAES
jgi:DNA-binding response OmpR family regulator